ncbi:MAG: glycosyltransferase family 4 protein [Bacteroidetes bacterium]|nr:glycosyltransferase family 4 protein [Bacteroidota bacterium]
MSNKKIILSHAGKQHSYYVAKNLLELDMLEKFCTSSYVREKYLQEYFAKKNNFFWTKRFIEGLYGNKVESHWRFEIKYFLAKKFYKNLARVESLVYEWDVNYDNYMAKRIKNFTADFFWGFQGSSLNTLKAAKDLGKTTICELSTAHITSAKKILDEECLLHPEWAGSISNLNFPSYFEKRLEEEPFCADYIFAASEFTKKTLVENNIEEKKIIKLPLGVDVSKIVYREKISEVQNRPLKLLYAGMVTQRKGIKYLLEAIKLFSKKDIELHIVGNVFGAKEEFEKQSTYYTYHRAVSQQELFKKYADFDVLVLPTVFEGFALVIVEAMAAGLPVITTPNCIGADIVDQDKNGYLVPIRNVKALQEAIVSLRNKSNNEFQQMRECARKSALMFSWENHKKNIQDIFNERIK